MEANTLARQVYEEQKIWHWSGPAKETAKICALLQIEDCNVTLIPKKYYWAIVTRACHYLNEERLRKMAENKEKCVRILVMFMEGNNILIIITFIRSDSILKHVSEWCHLLEIIQMTNGLKNRFSLSVFEISRGGETSYLGPLCSLWWLGKWKQWFK